VTITKIQGNSKANINSISKATGFNVYSLQTVQSVTSERLRIFDTTLVVCGFLIKDDSILQFFNLPKWLIIHLPGVYKCSVEAEDLNNYSRGVCLPVEIRNVFKGDRYRVIHKLGWGGYVTVWLARDTW
jgi:hypothetical protein